jgi:hypothetical protein
MGPKKGKEKSENKKRVFCHVLHKRSPLVVNRKYADLSQWLIINPIEDGNKDTTCCTQETKKMSVLIILGMNLPSTGTAWSAGRWSFARRAA